MVTKPKYYQEAERLVGVKEVPGKGSNEKIDELFAEVGHPTQKDATPWCAAFVGGCLVRGNKKSTETLVARDYISDKFADRFEKLKKPEKYCIGVMKRGNSTWEGHVGFVADFDAKYVTLLGGNQSDMVSYAKYPRSSFLGFVKPKEKSTDVTDKQLKKDSRQLKVGTWYERLTLALTGAATAAFQFIAEFKSFVSDNWGFILLGTLGLILLVNKTHEFYLKNAYKDGRYLPKAHE